MHIIHMRIHIYVYIRAEKSNTGIYIYIYVYTYVYMYICVYNIHLRLFLCSSVYVYTGIKAGSGGRLAVVSFWQAKALITHAPSCAIRFVTAHVAMSPARKSSNAGNRAALEPELSVGIWETLNIVYTISVS